MPSVLDLDTYSAEAEEFLAELNLEYHLHFSGQKSTYEVEAIYERHRELFSREAIDDLRQANEAAVGEERRRTGRLLELAVGSHLGRACAPEQAAVAAREAELVINVDRVQTLYRSEIPYRMAPVEQANEADPERRRAIEAARMTLLEEEINPLHLEVLQRSHELVAELGWPSYAAAFSELSGVDLEGLARQTSAFLEATGDVYERLLDPELEAVLGFGHEQARRADLARFFRAPALDASFADDRLLPSFTETMAGLGLDLGSQPNIILDTEQRPTKTPRAYCAPVRIPGEIHLVVSKVGGREDFAALFHEGGHAEHFAHVDPSLPVEYRHLGDNSVTESFAFLFEHIAEDPAWLSEALGADPDPIVSHVRAVRLYFLRRYAAKISYELELHGEDADLEKMPARYAELLGAATAIPWNEELWLDDVDGGFYVASYLRAWALEVRWRTHLRERFGQRWFSEPAAGEWLAGLWSGGQRLRADELLAESLGEELRFETIAAEFG
jgi:oligoendopeptidase F